MKRVGLKKNRSCLSGVLAVTSHCFFVPETGFDWLVANYLQARFSVANGTTCGFSLYRIEWRTTKSMKQWLSSCAQKWAAVHLPALHSFHPHPPLPARRQQPQPRFYRSRSIDSSSVQMSLLFSTQAMAGFSIPLSFLSQQGSEQFLNETHCRYYDFLVEGGLQSNLVNYSTSVC